MPDLQEVVLGGKPLSLNDLNDAAGELLRDSQDIKIWLFSGEMGAGKTTLIKAIGVKLEVQGTMSSPTFSIIHEYETSGGEAVYHFDFYRLKNEQEAYDIGVEEYFESGCHCLIEWPERIPSLIPTERIEIKIMPASDPEHRIIQYIKHD
jgi:tRNA threonylcarbamoyladenosine biosynthesis protein TsaE